MVPVLPHQVWKIHIFSNLSLQDLTKSSRVCKQWYEWTSDDAVWRRFDLQALFPKIKIEYMDAEFWERHIPVKCAIHAPAISKRQIIAALARIKGAATASIVAMPKHYSMENHVKLTQIYQEGQFIQTAVHDAPT